MPKENTIEIYQIAADDSEKLVMMDFEQNDIGSHDHRFFELAYVTGGSADHILNGASGRLRAGDYFILDYGSVHCYENCRDFTLINCLFLPEVIDETLRCCQSLEALLQGCLIRYYRTGLGEVWANRIFHDGDGRVKSLLEGMVEEYRCKRLGSAEIFRCRLTEILILTLRSLVQPQQVRTKSRVTAELIRYVDASYQGRPTLQDFCERQHYSLSYVSRRFKQETGMTFREYLQKVRMEKCCALLLAGDMTVSEAAGAVGYEDMQFFHEVFRKYLHMTPKEYRRLGGKGIS